MPPAAQLGQTGDQHDHVSCGLRSGDAFTRVRARARAPLRWLRSVLSRRLTVDVTVQIGDRLGAEHQFDAAWIAKTDKVRTASLRVLRRELASDR